MTLKSTVPSASIRAGSYQSLGFSKGLQWRNRPRAEIGLLSCRCRVDSSDGDCLTTRVGRVFDILEHDPDGVFPTP